MYAALNHRFVTVKFESNEVRDSFKDKEGNLPEDVIKAHKVVGTMTYDECETNDITNFLASTTTPVKMYQNNVLKDMTEVEILELVKTNPQKVNVKKDLLENRKSRTVDPTIAIGKNVAKLKEKGLSKEAIKAELMKQLELLG